MSIEITGVDVSAGLDLCDDDAELYLRILRAYVSAIPESLDKMRNVSAETLQNYVISVHGVKSTSTSIGAEEVRKRALQLEMMARAGDLSGVQAQNEEFIKFAAAIVDNVRSWLEKYDAGTVRI